MKKYLVMPLMLAAFLLAIAPAGFAQSVPSGWNLPISGYFGVNIHFKDDNLGAEIPALKNAGIGWVRRDLFWSDVEGRPGTYNFAMYDRLIGALRGAGIHVVMTLDYNNRNYDNDLSPRSDQGRAAFARFAAAAATHFAGKVDAWEIFNEPNMSFWKPAPDAGQYVLLANEVTAAIRQAAPGAVILGPALAGPTTAEMAMAQSAQSSVFLDKVLASPAAHQWNGITLHPYRGANSPPESTGAQLAMVRQMMKQHGIDPAKIPVIAGEWGYSSWMHGVDEKTQAAFAVREYLFAGIERMPFTIYYDWQDDGTNPMNNEHRFGLLRYGPLGAGGGSDAPESKPAYNAVKQLAGLLKGYRLDKVVQNTGSVMVTRYVDGQSVAYAAWSVDNGTHAINIPLEAGKWQATYLLGGTSAVSGQNAAVKTTPLPVILHK
jgi:hypothetical protein